MLIRRFFTPGLSIQSSLVFDEDSRQGVVIDPTRHVEVYLAKAIQENIEITDIFETHVHADFVSGALELKATLSGKPRIHCSGLGGQEWIPSYADDIIKTDRQEVRVGNIRFEAWHTPGHTPEHIIWVAYDEKRSRTVPECAFTGDLLFVGSVGRPDLLGNEIQEQLTKQLYRSLFDTLHHLPESLEIFPTHGAGSLCGNAISLRESSTLGYERRCNPWMIPQLFGKWQASLFTGISTPPAYFKRMKRLNVQGLEKREYQEMPILFTHDELAKHLKQDLIIDVRKPEAFAAKHLKGSINIPWAPPFALWAAIILPENKPFVLVTDHPGMTLPVMQALRLVGLDHVSGICSAEDWEKNGEERGFVSSPMIDVATLQAKAKEYFIVDVRTPGEWQAGYIEGAHHIELTKMPEALKDIPQGKPVAVVCHSGNRASIVTSLLLNEGIPAMNLRGGMQAWEKQGGQQTHTDRQK